MIDEARLTPDLLSDLTTLIGTPGVLGLMASVSFYKTLTCIVESYEVPLDHSQEFHGQIELRDNVCIPSV